MSGTYDDEVEKVHNLITELAKHDNLLITYTERQYEGEFDYSLKVETIDRTKSENTGSNITHKG